jgi:hypothetical protein
MRDYSTFCESTSQNDELDMNKRDFMKITPTQFTSIIQIGLKKKKIPNGRHMNQSMDNDIHVIIGLDVVQPDITLTVSRMDVVRRLKAYQEDIFSSPSHNDAPMCDPKI